MSDENKTPETVEERIARAYAIPGKDHQFNNCLLNSTNEQCPCIFCKAIRKAAELGTEKCLELEFRDLCEVCGGVGTDPNEKLCTHCLGSGREQ